MRSHAMTICQKFPGFSEGVYYVENETLCSNREITQNISFYFIEIDNMIKEKNYFLYLVLKLIYIS